MKGVLDGVGVVRGCAAFSVRLCVVVAWVVVVSVGGCGCGSTY